LSSPYTEAEVYYVVSGRAQIRVADAFDDHTVQAGSKVTRKAGDRLDLLANIIQDAVVGAQGVVCLEAHK